MTTVDRLVTELDKLSPEELEHVLDKLTVTRAKATDNLEPKAGFALWMAHQYLGLDPHLVEVIYLPSGSPANEVRLVTINSKLYPAPGDEGITPRTMTPAISQLPYKVVVADMTPEQWERVQRDSSLLPRGWNLIDRTRSGRKRP